MANFKEKQYTIDDIARIRKGMEENQQRMHEEKAKQTNAAPKYGYKLPTLGEISRKKVIEGTDAASMSLKTQNADRKAEAEAKKLAREQRANQKNLNNANRTMVQQYNSRFSLDKPILNNAKENLSNAMIRNAYEGKNSTKTANSKILDSDTLNDLDAEAKAIQAKGISASQTELDRLQEIYDLVQQSNDETDRINRANGGNHVVNNDRYNQLMSDSRFSNEIEALAMAEVNDAGTRGRGIRRLNDMGYKSANEYLEQLSRRYELSKDEIQDIVKTYQSNKTRAQEQKEADVLYNVAQKHPVLGSGMSLAGDIGGAVEGGYNVLAGALTNDERNLSNTFSTLRNAPRQGVADNIDNNVARGAYQMGMGLGDLGVGILTGNPALMMAGNTANDAMATAVQNGADVRRAAIYGAGAGAVDFVTNKIGLDKAKELAIDSLATTGIKRALATNAIAGAGEAGENIIQDVAQSFLDQIINGENSELNTSYNQKIASGMSEEEAFKTVAKEYAGQLATSAGTGYLMGSAMQGVPTLVKNAEAGYFDRKIKKQSTKTNSTVDDLLAQRAAEEVNGISNKSNEQISKEKAAITEQLNDLAQGNMPQDTLLETGNTVNTRSANKYTYYNEGRNYIDNKRLTNNIKFDNDTDKQAFDSARKKLHEALREWNDAKGNEQAVISAIEKMSTAYSEMKQVAQRGYETDKSVQEEYRRLKKDFADRTKGVVINISDELSDIPDTTLKALNSSMSTLGNDAIKFRRNSGSPIDQIWDELVSASGNQLDADIANKSDMIIALNEYVNSIKNSTKGGIERIPADVDRYIGEDFWDYITDTSDEIAGYDPVMAEDIGINPETDMEEGYTIESEPIQRNTYKEPGVSEFATNTAIGAGVVNKEMLDNDPILRKAAEIEHHSNARTFSDAMEVVNTRGDEWYDEVVNGKHLLGQPREVDGKMEYEKADQDFDTGMIILQNLADQISMTNDPIAKQALVAKRNALFAKMRIFSSNAARTLQAHAKWTDTADGAILNGDKIRGEQTRMWATRNASKVEGNKKIAQALAKIGYDGSMEKPAKAPLTHEQIRSGIKAEIQKEFGSVSDKFSDTNIEYLASLVENGVSTDIIADEIQHFLAHGEFYTIDESTPVKKKMSSKLANVLKNMGDDSLKESNKPLDNGYPKKSHATIVEEVTNTLEGEYAGLGLDKPTDIEFVATMVEEGVPNWQIEDEIRHRLDTGEWYTLDETIEAPKPKNQRLQNALNALVGEDVTPIEKPQPTLEELIEQVRNTLNEENASISDFTDDDIAYLAGLLSQGATKAELAEALNAKMATGAFGLSAETQSRVNDIFKAMDMVNPESKEYADMQLEAFRLIADEVNPKAGALEKFDSWRYLAMLGNPKTMIRNWLGNQMFNVVTGISNNVAALGEEIADRRSIRKTGHGIENRTKALINPFDRSAIKAARNDFNLMRYQSGAGTKYKDTKSAIQDASSTFDNGLVKFYEELVNKGISDTSAVRRKYATSLLGYMKANGLTEADMDASQKYEALDRLSRRKLLSNSEKAELDSLRETHNKMEKARDYALKEAEYATFHEDNKFANWLSQTANSNDVAKIFIDGMVPFKKTPANVLRSGLEYSPLGITKSGYLMIKRAVEMKGDYADTYETKKLLGKGTKEVQRTYANDVIDSWSKSLTGTGLAALGYLLFSKGILQSGSEDEKYQNDLEGLQNFSIKFNVGGKDRTYTIDWAAPAVMPLLLGAEVKKIMDEQAIPGNEMNPDDIVRIINSTLNPIMETSMLQGVQNTLETVARQASNANGVGEFAGGVLGSLATNLATGYVTQGIPTLSGQLARTIDGTRRTTDTKSTSSIMSEAEKQLRKTANKIPFASRLNTPYIDARGETQSNNPFEYSERFMDEPLKNVAKAIPNLLYQSLSPGYLAEVDTRASDQIARDAYNGLDENGKPIKDADVFADWKSSVKINGQKLAPKQLYDYRVAAGQANTQIRERLAQEEWFNNLSADRRTEILKSTNTLVDHIGKKAADDTYSTESSAYEAYENGGVDGVIDYYYNEAHNKDIKNALGSSADFQKQLYDSGDQNRIAKYQEGLNIAKQIMPDKKSLTEEQFLEYEKYGKSKLEKDLKYSQKANELDVSNSETFKKLVDAKVSDEKIKAASDAITSTVIGKDEYNRDKYMSFNDTTWGIYNKEGQAGLDNFALIQKAGGGKETYEAFKRYNNQAKTSTDLPRLDATKYMKKVSEIERYREKGDADGKVSQTELLGYLNAGNYSDSYANALWDAFIQSNTYVGVKKNKNGAWAKTK